MKIPVLNYYLKKGFFKETSKIYKSGNKYLLLLVLKLRTGLFYSSIFYKL